MQIKKFHVWFTLGVVLGALIGSLFYVSNLGEPDNKAIAFVTLGVDPLAGESSSYELQRAAEHFSHIVLGWTIEPAFEDEMMEAVGSLNFSGQRQEKQSMIFTVSGPAGLVFDTVPAVAMLDLLKQRIDEYNLEARANYTVAVERYSMEEGEMSAWRIVAGVTLLALVFSVLLLMTFENFYASRSRSTGTY
jgi:hypothetical protein